MVAEQNGWVKKGDVKLSLKPINNFYIDISWLINVEAVAPFCATLKDCVLLFDVMDIFMDHFTQSAVMRKKRDFAHLTHVLWCVSYCYREQTWANICQVMILLKTFSW